MSKWPLVPLGEVLSRRKNEIQLDDLTKYKRLTIRLKGKGIEVRDELLGAEIGTKKQYVVRAGQLLLSKIDARNGAFGIVPADGDNAIITGNFWTFDYDRHRLHLQYLDYLTKTPLFVDFCVRSSEGTTNRLYLREHLFLAQEIPLPPLSEQQKLVEWIDAIATRVEETKRLVEKTSKQMDDVSRSILWSDEEVTTPTPINELVEQRLPDVEVNPQDSYHFAGVYCFGRGVFSGQTKSGTEFKYPKLTRLKTRNFVYPKLMAWEGAFGVVPAECDGLVVSTEFPVFEINEDRILPEVLDIYFRTPSVWPEIAGASTGTNVRRRRLNPKDFLKHEFPLPPMETQRKIAGIKSRTDEILLDRRTAVDELDALLPSVLNQAFNGEG